MPQVTQRSLKKSRLLKRYELNEVHFKPIASETTIKDVQKLLKYVYRINEDVVELTKYGASLRKPTKFDIQKKINHEKLMLLKIFLNDMKRKEQSRIFYRGFNKEDNTEFLKVIKINHRWAKPYLNNIYYKIMYFGNSPKIWSFKYFNGCTTLITLTGSHGFGVEPIGFRIRFDRACYRFIDVLRKVYPGVEYIWVDEFHISGDPHRHLLVFCDISNENQDKLKKLWSQKYEIGNYKYGCDFVRHDGKHAQKIVYVARYISKYFVKMIRGSVKEVGKIVKQLQFNESLLDQLLKVKDIKKDLEKMKKIKKEEKEELDDSSRFLEDVGHLVYASIVYLLGLRFYNDKNNPAFYENGKLIKDFEIIRDFKAVRTYGYSEGVRDIIREYERNKKYPFIIKEVYFIEFNGYIDSLIEELKKDSGKALERLEFYQFKGDIGRVRRTINRDYNNKLWEYRKELENIINSIPEAIV